MSDPTETVAAPASRGKIVETLVRLSRAVQKTTIYPEGHPAIPAAVGVFLEGLRQATEDRSSIALGVACDRVLLDGEPIEAKNPALSWVAQQMYERGIGSVDLNRNVPAEDAERFVHWLAKSVSQETGGDCLPTLSGIALTRYDFARVRFGENPAGEKEALNDPVRVWHALMSSLFPGAEWMRAGDDLEDPEAFAKEVSDKVAKGEDISAADVASRVIAIGPGLAELDGPVREAVKRRVGTFVGNLTPELRSELLRVDPRSSRQKIEFVTGMVDALPDTTVLDVLGDLDRAGARVPHQFITLMNKLIGLSSVNPGLREHVGSKLETIGIPRALVAAGPEKVRKVLEEVLQSRIQSTWNPEHYQNLLETLSTHRLTGSATFSRERYGDLCLEGEVRAHLSEVILRLLVNQPDAPEASAYLKVLDEDAPRALESGRFEQVHEAARSVRDLALERADVSLEFKQLAESYLAGFSKEDRIERILSAAVEGENRLPESVAGLFKIAGADAAYAAFQKLALLSEGPEAERFTELLVQADPDLFNVAVARLRTEGWASLRVFFPVLNRIGGSRAVELALTFVGNEDHRVRIEAFRVLLASDLRPGQSDRYVERALSDESPRVVAFAMGLARQRAGSVTTALLGAYLRRESRGSDDDELRLRAISILTGFRTDEARDLLIDLLSSRRVALWVKDVRISGALEEALTQIGDEVSLTAVRAWRRSIARWMSKLLVGRVQK